MDPAGVAVAGSERNIGCSEGWGAEKPAVRSASPTVLETWAVLIQCGETHWRSIWKEYIGKSVWIFYSIVEVHMLWCGSEGEFHFLWKTKDPSLFRFL